MRQHSRPTEYDDLEVIQVDATPGMWASKGKGKLTLHNAENPCHNVDKIQFPRVMKLGKDVPPRPEFREFCDVCEWPCSEDDLYDAMMTVPEAYR